MRDLSRRELEVLALLAAGLSDKQIAARLGISESTAKTHATHIYAALGITGHSSRLHAVLWWQAQERAT